MDDVDSVHHVPDLNIDGIGGDAKPEMESDVDLSVLMDERAVRGE
jgi:hypothetical protein